LGVLHAWRVLLRWGRRVGSTEATSDQPASVSSDRRAQSKPIAGRLLGRD
jgi:hypothetical protein